MNMELSLPGTRELHAWCSTQPEGSKARTLAEAMLRAAQRRGAPALDEIALARRRFKTDTRPLELPRDQGMTTIGERYKQIAVSPQYGKVLYFLLKALEPGRCLELGTGAGSSTLYLGAALEELGAGELITIDAHAPTGAMARELVTSFGLTRIRYEIGLFGDVLPGILAEGVPVDFAFIDGHHQAAPTLRYRDMLLPHIGPHCVLVFDDISWSEEMVRAWSDLRSDERVGLAIETTRLGICYYGPVEHGHAEFRIEI